MSASLTEAPAAVDCHFHVFNAHAGEPGARYRPAYDAHLENWLHAARSCGIGRGVLVQTSFMGTNNRAVLAALAQNPAHLRGIAVIDPSAEPELVASLHAQGVRGLRLNLAGARGSTQHTLRRWLARGSAIWEAMEVLGWHFQLHTDTGELPAVLAALPGHLPVVLDHFARPAAAHAHDETLRAVAARARRAAVHVKLSAPYRLAGLEPAGLARNWLDVLGPDRLLWGSDWPCTNHESHADYGRLQRGLQQWLEEAALQEQVLVDNPARLYWS